MSNRHDAFKAKLFGPTLEFSNGDGVVEHIVEPAKASGMGRDAQTGPQKLQVVALPRPEHHAVLAEPDGLGVTIRRDVAHREETHPRRSPRSAGPGERHRRP